MEKRKGLMIGLSIGALLWTGIDAYHVHTLREKAEELEEARYHVAKRERQLDRLLGEATKGEYHGSKKETAQKQISKRADYRERTGDDQDAGRKGRI